MRARAIAGTIVLLGLLGAPPAQGAETTYTAALSAEEETPPGPAGGTGAATVTIDDAKGALCYDVSWSEEVGEPSNGHIHKGKKGLAGPVVVNLDLPTGCTDVEAGVLKEIAADPAGHYVNVHTNMYPGGAVRGQLKAG